VALPVDCHLLFTISEEVGSGASAVLHGDVAPAGYTALFAPLGLRPALRLWCGRLRLEAPDAVA
jgi:hypothetical protein